MKTFISRQGQRKGRDSGKSQFCFLAKQTPPPPDIENLKRKSPTQAWKTAVSTTAANADDKTHSAAFLQFMLVQSTNPVDECSK